MMREAGSGGGRNGTVKWPRAVAASLPPAAAPLPSSAAAAASGCAAGANVAAASRERERNAGECCWSWNFIRDVDDGVAGKDGYGIIRG